MNASRALCLAGGFGAIAFALARSDGHGGLGPLSLVLAGVGAWTAAATVRGGRVSWRAVVPAVWLLALVFTVLDLAMNPGLYIPVDTPRWPAIALEALAVALVASYGPELALARPAPPAFAWGRRALLVSIACALGAWMLRVSPAPKIDVWEVHQQGAAALLHGRSIYGGDAVGTLDTHSFARTIHDYAYPPLNAVLTAAAFALTGETRWAALAAQVLAAVLLWQLGRRRTQLGAAWADSLAALLLFFPRGLFVLEQAWGEPLALPLLAGVALAHARRKPMLAAVLLGLLFALKQYFVLFAPLLLAGPAGRGRRALVAVAVAAATLVPFVLADPAGVWRSLVVHHLANPFRPDSLSLPGALFSMGVIVPSWLGIAAAAAPYALLPSSGRDVADLLLVCCLSLAGFFVFGRQAFCNYYYLVCGAALTALAAAGSLRVEVRAPLEIGDEAGPGRAPPEALLR